MKIRLLSSIQHRILRQLRSGRQRTLQARVGDSYPVWISENEPTSQDLAAQREVVHQFSYQPLLSIIAPTYNPDSDQLHR